MPCLSVNQARRLTVPTVHQISQQFTGQRLIKISLLLTVKTLPDFRFNRIWQGSPGYPGLSIRLISDSPSAARATRRPVHSQMIAVIAVLPDKSGLPKRKPWDR